MPRRKRASIGIVSRLGALCALAFTPLLAAATPDDALRAHALVEAWVRAGSVPEGDSGAFDLAGAGVSVTLRLDGQIVGQGQVMDRGDDALASAARRAWLAAERRLVPERDALRDERLRDAAQRVTVDLEIALTMTPLFGETIAQASGGTSPGLDGVAARKAETIEAVFPGAMLAMNATPGEALRSVVSELTGPLTTLPEARAQGAIVYRFDTMRVAQLAADEPAMFLTRGGRVRPLRDVNPTGIRAFGDRVEANLLSRLWPGEEPLGLLGTYEPWTGAYEDPMLAPAREQAMAALALAKWARARSADEASAFGRMALALRVLDDLATVHESEVGPGEDVVAAAMIVLALREVAEVAPPGSLSPDLLVLSGAMQGVVEAAYSETDGFSADLRAGERAVVAHALAALGSGEAPARALLRESDPASLPGLMPWIGWAMETTWPGEAAMPGMNALLDFRTLCWRHQLRLAELPTRDGDLAGGIVFTMGGSPAPTAQTARALAFIATMLGDPRLTTEEEIRPEVARLAESIRFLMQLEMGPVEAGMFRTPERSLGGVRMALWDSRLRLDSASLTLLALAETVNSLQNRTGAGPNADN